MTSKHVSSPSLQNKTKKPLTGTPARKLGLILHNQQGRRPPITRLLTGSTGAPVYSVLLKVPVGPLGAAERLPLTAPSDKSPFEETTSTEQEEAAGSATHGGGNL